MSPVVFSRPENLATFSCLLLGKQPFDRQAVGDDEGGFAIGAVAQRIEQVGEEMSAFAVQKRSAECHGQGRIGGGGGQQRAQAGGPHLLAAREHGARAGAFTARHRPSDLGAALA